MIKHQYTFGNPTNSILLSSTILFTQNNTRIFFFKDYFYVFDTSKYKKFKKTKQKQKQFICYFTYYRISRKNKIKLTNPSRY